MRYLHINYIKWISNGQVEKWDINMCVGPDIISCTNVIWTHQFVLVFPL